MPTPGARCTGAAWGVWGVSTPQRPCKGRLTRGPWPESGHASDAAFSGKRSEAVRVSGRPFTGCGASGITNGR